MHPALDRVLLTRLTAPLRPFYRRYPFTSPVSIRSADDRGCVDMDLGFFCNRVPKAANSTVMTNLARLKFGADVASRDAKQMFATPARLNAAEVARFEQLFKFTVVRNPYTRTLSAYLDKVERRARREGRESSFRAFLLSLKEGALYRNAHWAPQSALMLIPVEKFDFIGKVESLEQDLEAIKRRIRPDLEQPVTSFRGNATGAGGKLRAYYDDESIALVRDIYRRDFEAFHYDVNFVA
jgi:hypothetical protein